MPSATSLPAMTRLAQFGSGVCIAAVEAMMIKQPVENDSVAPGLSGTLHCPDPGTWRRRQLHCFSGSLGRGLVFSNHSPST